MRRALGIIPLLLSTSLCLAAQPDRISGTIDGSRTVILAGSVHAKAQAQFDQGPVEPSFQLPYITMVMQPSAKQQTDLQQLLQQQQDPASPNYRKWLTPEQYADRFGVSQNDIEKVSVWLRSQGFSIVQAARGRDWIAFSGTAALVESTFRTQIHYFNANGEQHFANVTNISIPRALAGIVVGFRGLDNFTLKPMGIKELGPSDFFPILLRPFYNTTSEGHLLAPDDIATIYDITPLYNANINGTGMKMVVVGQVDVSASLSDIDNFRSAFGLTKNDPQQTIVPGSPNPGTNNGDMGESKLDLEWAGAVARDATILFITADALTAGGVSTAAQYAIDQDLAPVISMSYGGCESQNVTFIPVNEPEQQKANTEGITFLASSGDAGAAGCDADNATVATGGLAVNYPASSPEVTGVGGNEFNEGSGTYWNTSNGANGGSAISYIPEMAWNDTLSRNSLSASGGGASSCGQTSGTTCLNGFAKPTWQAGTGVPNDGVRDVPDVALTASPDHDGYIICDGGNCASGVGSNPTLIVGGTSASTPVFAGIVTLMNQFLGGTGLGNINTRLYQLAQSSANGVFHDVTTGNNIVPCTPGTPSTFPKALQCPSGGSFGYNAGVGYDQVTGLGSVDAHALAVNFSGSATTTTLTSNSNPANSGSSVTFTATVTPTGSTAPTGTVSFNDGATAIGTGSLTTSAGKTTATFSSSTLADGGHSLTAVYPGDSKSAPSTSAALIETIEGTGTSSTTTTVTPGQAAVAYGTSTSFTATVTTTNSTVPGATVTFEDGGTPLGFVALTPSGLSSGTATFTTSTLTVGAHSITGLYSGDASNNKSSTSSAVAQTITQAATTTTLASVSSPVNAGASVTLSATVSYAAGNPPNGETVTFKDNNTGKTLGTGSLAAGNASFTSSSIAGGSYAVVASYGGDTNLLASSSAAQTLSVQDFTVAANPTTVSISAPGQSGSTTLTITPLGGFSQALNFNCTGLPSEATCTFASAGTNKETITIATTAASGWKRPFGHGSGLFYAMLLPGVMGLVLPARKRSLRGLVILLAILAVLVLWMPACGGGGGGGSNTNPGTPTGSSNVTITASTAGTGSLVSHAVTVTLSVQ